MKFLISEETISEDKFIIIINNPTYILFNSIEQNIGLKVIITYVVSLPVKFRTKTYTIMAIEVPGGKRNLKMNINAQQAILNAYITNKTKRNVS